MTNTTHVRIAPTVCGQFRCTMYENGRYIAREIRNSPARAFNAAQRLGANWVGSFCIPHDVVINHDAPMVFTLEGGR